MEVDQKKPAAPWYSQNEIDDMCAPRTQKSAQVRFLRSQGLTVIVRPNRTAMVMRAQAERILSGLKDVATPAANDQAPARSDAKPDRERFKLIHGKRGA